MRGMVVVVVVVCRQFQLPLSLSSARSMKDASGAGSAKPSVLRRFCCGSGCEWDFGVMCECVWLWECVGVGAAERWNADAGTVARECAVDSEAYVYADEDAREVKVGEVMNEDDAREGIGSGSGAGSAAPHPSSSSLMSMKFRELRVCASILCGARVLVDGAVLGRARPSREARASARRARRVVEAIEMVRAIVAGMLARLDAGAADTGDLE
ncbi:hypothetical protein FIBSPDRAFT_905461, partial [Athelia psychrophila]